MSVPVQQPPGALLDLETLLHNFENEPGRCRKWMRDLAERDCSAFYAGAIRILQSQPDSHGLEYIVSLAAAHDLLPAALCDKALNREQAVRMARMALQADPFADVKLARQLAEEKPSGHARIANAQRVLDILAEVSNGSRLRTSLVQLLRHPNSQIRSKAVLMLGRSNRAVKWQRHRRVETDARGRANMIESLWGVNNSEARELLQEAARDSNNRIAGNALIGLYGAGDTSTIAELFKMADSESAAFRSTAAWVMGATGDPRFSETLARLLGEQNHQVRRRAFAGLADIRAAGIQRRQGREWSLTARFLPDTPGSPCSRHLRLEAVQSDGSLAPKLPGTQFVLIEDGQQVRNYQVEGQSRGEIPDAHFILPAAAAAGNSAWTREAGRYLSLRRSSNSWTVTLYAPEDLWTMIRDAVQPPDKSAAAGRWLVIDSQADAAVPAGLGDLIAAALKSNIAVYAVSQVPNAALEELCRRTLGNFQVAASEAEAAHAAEAAYGSLVARYLIHYQPPLHSVAAHNLTVRLFDVTGWGELTVPLPR